MSVDALEPPEEDPEGLDEEEEEQAPVLDQLPEVPTPARRRNKVEVRQLAFEMWQEYASGMNQKTIAQLHGVSQPEVSYHLRRFARQYGRREIDRARRLDLERIEALIDAHHTEAIGGDEKKTKLILIMIKLRSDILGYAAPKKIEHSGETRVGVSPELAGILSQVRERNDSQRADLTRIPAGELEGPIEDAEIVED